MAVDVSKANLYSLHSDAEADGSAGITVSKANLYSIHDLNTLADPPESDPGETSNVWWWDEIVRVSS